MVWQAPKDFLQLTANQVHLWQASLVDHQKNLALYEKLLNSQEKCRAQKLVTKTLKNNFIIARGILRQLLARYLNLTPQQIEFQQNPYGKLYLKNSNLQFNLSHSHELALFAFTLQHHVGVDIEFIQPKDTADFIAIAQRFFAKKEILALQDLPKAEQLPAFFSCWSRREALIKADGKGIFCSPTKFWVEVSSKREGKLQLEFSDHKNWSLWALDPMPGYVGALATSFSKCNTYCYIYS